MRRHAERAQTRTLNAFGHRVHQNIMNGPGGDVTAACREASKAEIAWNTLGDSAAVHTCVTAGEPPTGAQAAGAAALLPYPAGNDGAGGPDGAPVYVHADQLEVSPDGAALFYQSCTGPLWRVPTRLLDDPGTMPATLAAAFAFVAPAALAQPKPGTDYSELKGPQPVEVQGKVEVVVRSEARQDEPADDHRRSCRPRAARTVRTGSAPA